jgi:hypothetical protein
MVSLLFILSGNHRRYNDDNAMPLLRATRNEPLILLCWYGLRLKSSNQLINLLISFHEIEAKFFLRSMLQILRNLQNRWSLVQICEVRS